MSCTAVPQVALRAQHDPGLLRILPKCFTPVFLRACVPGLILKRFCSSFSASCLAQEFVPMPVMFAFRVCLSVPRSPL